MENTENLNKSCPMPAQLKQEIIDSKNVAHYANLMSDWIANAVAKANRKGVVLGMSGGVDCSVVARLCQIANVPVQLISMPYGESMSRGNNSSMQRCVKLVDKFDFEWQTFNITKTVNSMLVTENSLFWDKSFTPEAANLAKANVCARIRMNHLYQMAQLMSRFVIGTGNLSERYCGYFTKWGDGACDLNPLGWCTKREVYVLAEYLGVPKSIINEKPSADLWEGQSDEEELGFSYEQLDDFILYATPEFIANENIRPGIVKTVMGRNLMSQHKLKAIPMFKLIKNVQL